MRRHTSAKRCVPARPNLSLIHILRQALSQAHDARMFILGKMLECLPAPRDHMSKYAPKITRFMINPDKIREVIGPGGKMINKIIAETGVKIDIEDDGRVYISTPDEEASKRARSMIEDVYKRQCRYWTA